MSRVKNPYANIDTSTFPLVRVRFSKSNLSEKNFDLYLDSLLQLYTYEEKFVMIFDARSGINIGFKYQKKQAEWMQTNKALIRTFCKGSVFIADKAITRVSIDFIFHVTRELIPYKIVRDEKLAFEWAKKRLGLEN